MQPRVLLVYANPMNSATPVVPYGMERIAHSLRMAGCVVQMLAPFLEADPLETLKVALNTSFDLIGFSIRNIDDALVVRNCMGDSALDTTFFLDDVKPLIQESIARVGRDRVLLGGAALGAGCAPVLRYLDARWGIRGPADDIMWRVGRGLVHEGKVVFPDGDPRVVDGHAPFGKHQQSHQSPVTERGWGKVWQAPPGPTPRMGPYLGLALARKARIPIRVSTGCDRRCGFCVEARFTGYAVMHRAVEEIVAEIDALAQVGVRRFWLGCSELNVPHHRHAIELFQALKRFRGQLDFKVFIQPSPVDNDLLDALEGAGLDPTSLSFEFGHLDDGILRAGGGPSTLKSIHRLVELWNARGYKQLGGSVLFGAHLDETMDSVNRAIDNALEIDRALPEGLGLAYACGGRVYPETTLADRIQASWDECEPDLYTLDAEPPDRSFVRPVVFCRPQSPRKLLASVQERLASARGNMGPMNAEAPAAEPEQAADALVNRGIYRLQEQDAQSAHTCFEEALENVPNHLEALRQVALVRANRLNDREGAKSALQRLVAILEPTDARRGEVLAALQHLE